MKTIVISGTGELETAVAYGLGRLSFNVVIADLNAKDRTNLIKHVAAAGVKISGQANSVYDSSWENSILVISSKLYHANFCYNKRVKLADLYGDPTYEIDQGSNNSLNRCVSSAIFKNLGLAPNWAHRMRTMEADHCWTKIQKVLGFSAAAAAACFALGHYNQSKKVVSFQDVAPLAYQRNLDIIEGRKTTWRGRLCDE